MSPNLIQKISMSEYNLGYQEKQSESIPILKDDKVDSLMKQINSDSLRGSDDEELDYTRNNAAQALN